ncbi:exopolysaccharide biosynthesis polyprenyl glycosylphosphotransferase [Algibacter amylolyticus]|uniref:Exopolysaccharide biosynthesis polyprenyl glycosylphosphotransferase n=1 Tax=Algibacter amylolyticus TaxID=1608400 RepID=A0A5M7B4P5_9FLAO|nr:exopolysaccharide biosynthesis polyprenyl glycosylphosphotransferase [Algibacter amylolyticus]KAA5822424.1 exopolysaccharide biosynthesis polyprenyl glycosylphosphotransferase [Algibacter amylolyticus]MBB5269145.1 exopolysaccharide biosynthesis polyprenyl glycosylphosphotransferase [Algibacter amylolyticus]TSJ73574.1 exopolysaccharide biosynthesis polyprenyl glycosylphosphotransferase [Algibacter amylolyticus]
MAKSSIHFNISERKILLRVFDIVTILSVLYLVGNTFDFDYFILTTEKWAWGVILILYISVFGTIFEIYDLQKSSKIDSIASGIVLTSSITVLFYLLTPFFTPLLPDNRLQILFFYFSILSALFIWRICYVTFIGTPRFYKKVLIIGETSNIETIIEAFKGADPNYKIIGFVNCEVNTLETIRFKGIKEYLPSQIREVINQQKISEIVVASYNSENITSEVYYTLIKLLEEGFPINEYTQVYEDMTNRVPVQFVGKDFYKYFPFSRSNQNKLYLFFHRLFDILIAIIGILIGTAVLPIILIGNLLGNRGPLFYSQDRIGKNGKIFKIIKFRTMIKNAEKSGAVWAKKGDSRITPFGKFMRHSRLDEFPQFINILKGEMSLIGPRPERPFFVKELAQMLPFYETRHIVKPGLTGWAQVKTRYGASIDDSLLKLQYDLYYIKHRGFFIDMNIVIKTLSTMIFFRGQ